MNPSIVSQSTPSDRYQQQELELAIASTFTSEPIEESLRFWMSKFGLQSSIEFAPYNQIFQQLLDPQSLLSTNQNGINIILLCFEDWLRNEPKENLNSEEEQLHRKDLKKDLQDLLLALKSRTEQFAIPYIICLCPASPRVEADNNLVTLFKEMEEQVVATLDGVNSIYLIKPIELSATYPVSNYYDPYGEELGHVPYTSVFFTALGTAIARQITAIKRPMYKVIVLDCDQTLWKGVCGEEGVMGIEIDPPRKQLQEFMVRQHDAGKLICLCSKNNEEDVVEVYDRRSDMPLNRQHIVSWRVNWQPKSENIKSLAQELNLGLDSFIFVDDNPVECAEVQANCPEVLILQLPQDEKSIPKFLQHIWAFDQLKTTDEDKQRTALYQQNIQRDRFQQEAPTLGDFLAGLNLNIEILETEPSMSARVSQLTQRTNQFNFTTIRRSEGEIETLAQSGKHCLAVKVSDRFGDYGLVGVIIYGITSNAIEVDTFLLSCRTLGKGVEHQMLAKLGKIAEDRHLPYVNVYYIPTQKNRLVLNFLEKFGSNYKQNHDNRILFQFPVQVASAISYNPVAESSSDTSTQPKPVPSETGTQTKTTIFSQIATELSDPEQILAVIQSQRQARPDLAEPFVSPQTPVEQVLAKLCAEVLKLESVGIHDNYFDLGGTSLLAVQLFTQIEKTFGKKLPLATLFQAATVEQLAKLIEQDSWTAPWSSLVAIQPNGLKPPLFCLHGGKGNILSFHTFPSYLSFEQPIYGLQSLGLDGKQTPYSQVEDMAAHYIKEMRGIQPTGPYFLVGYCFGGLIAFEMAQQLHSQGEKVALLGLIDTTQPSVVVEKLSWRDRISHHLNNAWQKGAPYVLDKIYGRYLWLRIKLQSLSGKIKPPLADTVETSLEAVEAANLQAEQSYIPKAYSGCVTLFRASDRAIPEEAFLDTDLGWGALATGLEIYEIPGDHLRIFKEPQVKILTEKLQTCLNQAQTAN